MNRFVYMDHAATTPVSPEVLAAMLPALTDCYGNPSGMYSKGRQAADLLDTARQTVARCLGALPEEIFFTSGGSESDNWAIRGAAALGAKAGRRHIVTTAFEHHAVLHTLDALKAQGFSVTHLPVGPSGIVDPQAVRSAIREDTCLVTVMYANNEIGTIQPIDKIGAICRQAGILFHTDAVQAVGQIPMDLGHLPVDMLSLSGHKLHAPKGVGALYIRQGIALPNLICGGMQEQGRRAGTENLPGILGLARAMELACTSIRERKNHLLPLRDALMEGLSRIEGSHLNGDRNRRLPGNVHFSFEGIDSEALLLQLDSKGICASSGSACMTGSLEPSHVLLALGQSPKLARGALRLTLGDENTMEDVQYLLEVLPKLIRRLRAMSPAWEEAQTP